MQGSRTYGALAFLIENGRWGFSEVEPHVVIRMKDVFRKIPKEATGLITLPNSPDICADLYWFLQRYPMRMLEVDRFRLNDGKDQYDAIAAEVGRILMPDFRREPYAFKDGLQPYDYQAQAAEVIRTTKSLLLMDDVGLGKSFSAMAALVSEPKMLPAAIVVDAHLADQWKEEYIESATNLSAHIIAGTRPYSLPKADVYIFRYSNIHGWADIASHRPFRSLILDEPQSFRKGQDTQKGRAGIVFRDCTDYHLGLTATPIYNYGNEIWEVMQFINPDVLGGRDEFLREWCTGDRIVKDPDALGTFLREQHATLRRTEEEVGSQLPVINRIAHEIPFDDAMLEDAEKRARLLAMKVVGGTFTERGNAARELDAFTRHTTGVAKARYVADYVRILLDAKVPVLLGLWHRECYAIMNKELADYHPLMYTGSESRVKKRRAKEDFLSGKSDLLMMSLRSGAGLDKLQFRSSTVVFGEMDWSPQVHRQMYGRLRRPGQTEQVDAIYLWTNWGSDPVIIETHGLKASQQRGIVDPLKGAEPVHSDDTRIKRLAERFLGEKAVAAAQIASTDSTVTRLADWRRDNPVE